MIIQFYSKKMHKGVGSSDPDRQKRKKARRGRAFEENALALAADVDVRAANDGFAVATAMRCFVTFSGCRFPVDENGAAAFSNGVHIGAAAGCMDAFVIFAGGIQSVDKNIAGTCDNGSGAGVRADRTCVRIR